MGDTSAMSSTSGKLRAFVAEGWGPRAATPGELRAARAAAAERRARALGGAEAALACRLCIRSGGRLPTAKLFPRPHARLAHVLEHALLEDPSAGRLGGAELLEKCGVFAKAAFPSLPDPFQEAQEELPPPQPAAGSSPAVPHTVQPNTAQPSSSPAQPPQPSAAGTHVPQVTLPEPAPAQPLAPDASTGQEDEEMDDDIEVEDEPVPSPEPEPSPSVVQKTPQVAPLQPIASGLPKTLPSPKAPATPSATPSEASASSSVTLSATPITPQPPRVAVIAASKAAPVSTGSGARLKSILKIRAPPGVALAPPPQPPTLRCEVVTERPSLRPPRFPSSPAPSASPPSSPALTTTAPSPQPSPQPSPLAAGSQATPQPPLLPQPHNAAHLIPRVGKKVADEVAQGPAAPAETVEAGAAQSKAAEALPPKKRYGRTEDFLGAGPLELTPLAVAEVRAALEAVRSKATRTLGGAWSGAAAQLAASLDGATPGPSRKAPKRSSLPSGPAAKTTPKARRLSDGRKARLETAGSRAWPRICGLCLTEVEEAEVNPHIYSAHIRQPLVRCPVKGCSFSSSFDDSLVRDHVKAEHPDNARPVQDHRLAYSNDLRRLSKEAGLI